MQVFSLKPTPPANAFLPIEKLSMSDEKFPLDLFFCNSCSHVQLLDVVNPEILFKDYVYVSGTSPVFVEHFRKYALALLEQSKAEPNSFIVDIGSNDGTLLRFFQEKNMQVLGIDPAEKIATDATRRGIKTLPLFFSSKLANQIVKENGMANIVVANNVFAHIDDLIDVVQGVRTLLKSNGLFSFEVSYLSDVFEKNLFDTVYHEHLCYHSVKPLKHFFSKNGLELIDVQAVNTHGGSLRGTVQHQGGNKPISPSVEEFIEREAKLGLHMASTFQNYSKKIDLLKLEFRNLILNLISQGKRLAGFGAPAKATTLMHHFEISGEVLEFIVDDNPLKQGLYTPGFHVPILPVTAIIDKKPDYLVILAWNFADSIIAQQKDFRDRGGKFIIPLPELRIV